MTLKCLIVEDELLAQEVLEKYISSLPSLELVKKCGDASEAIDFLLNKSVDLIFLDIRMPDLSGIDFLKTLKYPPKVIITTAYPEYALEGYEYSVVDYLVKPISYERFLKAVNKISGERGQTSTTKDNSIEDFIFIKEDKVIHKVYFSEILYIEGCGNFIKIVMGKRSLLYLERMKNIENRIPAGLFVRVHKSYIVSIKKIELIEGNRITIGNKTIPVSRHYRINLDNIIKRFNIRQ